jgi:hypothetical protein
VRTCRAPASGPVSRATIGDIASPLWLGVILVAANPRRVMLSP